jgi:flagellar hook-associated protein 3 FlgL
MRITANQIIKNMVYVINDRFYDMSRLQEQLSTGKRLLRPSDAPVDVANDLKLKTKLSEITQFKSNIEDGQAWMSVTDTSMMSMTELLQRMRELAIEGSTDTMSGNERLYINKEVEQLFRQVVALVNTLYKANYIFNGTETKVPPLVLQSSSADTPEDYNNLSMAYFNAGGMAVPATVQIFNGFDDSPITNIIPGTFNLQVGATTYLENTDYTIDYNNGAITLLNPALAADVTPGTANYAFGQFKISFDYLTPGRDIYGSVVSNRGPSPDRDRHHHVDQYIGRRVSGRSDHRLKPARHDHYARPGPAAEQPRRDSRGNRPDRQCVYGGAFGTE